MKNNRSSHGGRSTVINTLFTAINSDNDEKSLARKWARKIAKEWDGFSNGFPPRNLETMLARCKPISAATKVTLRD